MNIDYALKFSKEINKSIKGTFIYAYPSSLVQYIKIIKSHNINICTKNVKSIICTSEMLFDDDKFYIEKFFDTKVLNIYGANDGGIMSASIDNKLFFYNGLDCIVETVELNNNKELILTNLNSQSFPFIRYRVGDIGLVNNTDKSEFVICNLIGRTRDFIHISDKEKIHGSSINKIFKKFQQIKDYQIVQDKKLFCEISIVCTNNIKQSDEDLLIKDLNTLLKKIKYNIVYKDCIVKTANMKQKNIISYFD